MASPAPKGSSGSKRHSRHASSSNRAPLTRSLTKGPLESNENPATETPPTPGTVVSEAANAPIPITSFSEHVASTSSPPTKDFSYLLRPEVYHPLSQLDLPTSFRTAHHQPPSSQPLPHLLSHNNFRSAATAAALRLSTPPEPPPPELFALLYTRLACLTLINHLPLAAEEAKALQDINSSFYRDENTGKHILPWHLRALAARLQGIGYGDPKKSISRYYDLARDARAEFKEAKKSQDKQLWKERLQDLGMCVANTLIEMGDLGAAARHLESLRGGKGSSDEMLNARLALVHLHLGDLDAARRSLSLNNDDTDNTDSTQNATLPPLLTMAEGRYADAVDEWRELAISHPELKDLADQNLAVCLFYTGELDETLALLDGLIEKGRSLRALTFNLATVYELCSERGGKRKDELVARVAGGIEECGGGERSGEDFKL